MDDLAELRLRVPSEASDAVANLLAERVGSGFEERDTETVLATGEGFSELVVWVPAVDADSLLQDLERLIRSLREMGVDVDPFSCSRESTDDREWREAYKEHFKVNRIGRRFVVKPSWEEFEPQGSDLVIELDPGMAFGTGLHASTRLVMSAIERLSRALEPKTVLDLGCGAGILAIAAAKIWPNCNVVAVDRDLTAVRVCSENVARNGLESRVSVKQQSGADVRGIYELIVANLTFELLDPLRPKMRELLPRSGRIVLSGLLADQAQSLSRSYCGDLLFEPEYTEEQDGWRALLLRAGAAVTPNRCP